jgi:hypothetical protein
MNPDQYKLFLAAQNARVALDECIGVFRGLAEQGRYPEALIGRGWRFATEARDALIPAVQPFMPGDNEQEPPEDFGRL